MVSIHYIYKMEEYSWEEIAKHNTVDSLWLVVSGKIYDVTTFIDEHPGGPEVFLELAGKDATDDFMSISNHLGNPELEKFMETLVVGKTVDSKK